MRTTTIIVLVTLFYSFNSIHKDRIELPKSAEFIFADNTHVNVKSEDLQKYDQDILTGKLKVSQAILFFQTGEKIKLINSNGKWKSIQVLYEKKKLAVPKKTLNKISEIHFSSVALLWSDDSKKAVESKNFYIRMDIGIEKSFGKLTNLNLSFDDDKFSGAVVWKGVAENSVQWSEF